MGTIREGYEYFRERGFLKEDARDVLPNACHTSLIMTFNARSLRNLLTLRTDREAQKEIQEMARKMGQVVVDHGYGVFFEYLQDMHGNDIVFKQANPV